MRHRAMEPRIIQEGSQNTILCATQHRNGHTSPFSACFHRKTTEKQCNGMWKREKQGSGHLKSTRSRDTFLKGWSFNLTFLIFIFNWNTFLVVCNVQNIAIDARCEWISQTLLKHFQRKTMGNIQSLETYFFLKVDILTWEACF